MLSTDRESPDYRNVVRVHGVLPTGELVSVSGTLTGPRQVEKLVEVDGFDIELVAEKHVLFFRYDDRPGVVGVVGARLGDAGVNIAGAQVSRTAQGGDALMALTVDSAVPHEVLEQLAREIGAQSVRSVDLS
jgi:D-3-phosphoglycerate dehydrogenase